MCAHNGNGKAQGCATTTGGQGAFNTWRAQELLSTTKLSIAEVGFQVGRSPEQQFSHLVRRITGRVAGAGASPQGRERRDRRIM